MELFAPGQGVLVRFVLRENPFPDEPPAHVRAIRYRSRFTTPEERAETGQWWERERVGTYVPATSADGGDGSGLGHRPRQW